MLIRGVTWLRPVKTTRQHDLLYAELLGILVVQAPQIEQLPAHCEQLGDLAAQTEALGSRAVSAHSVPDAVGEVRGDGDAPDCIDVLDCGDPEKEAKRLASTPAMALNRCHPTACAYFCP